MAEINSTVLEQLDASRLILKTVRSGIEGIALALESQARTTGSAGEDLLNQVEEALEMLHAVDLQLVPAEHHGCLDGVRIGAHGGSIEDLH